MREGNLLSMLMGETPPPSAKREKKKSAPLPELVDDGWRVKESEFVTNTDTVRKEMTTTFKASQVGLLNRLREMGHVALTPAVDTKQVAEEVSAPQALIDAIEDARVMSMMSENENVRDILQAPVSDDEWQKTQDERIRRMIRGGEHGEVAAWALYFASRYTPLAETVDRHIPKSVLDTGEAYLCRLHEATFDEVPVIAKEIMDAIFPPPEECEGEGEGEGEGEEGSGDLAEAITAKAARAEAVKHHKHQRANISQFIDAHRDASSFGAVLQPSRPEWEGDDEDYFEDGEGLVFDHDFNAYDSSEDGPLGPKRDIPEHLHQAIEVERQFMAFEKLPLPNKLPRLKVRQSRRVPRNRDDGGRVRAIHRARIDGKVFQRKVPDKTKRRVGTLLIDTSGSMGTQGEQIREILMIAPSATIAIYSGWNGLSGPGQTGKLWIIAEKQRYCDLSIFHYDQIVLPGKNHGNEVDLPALEWLAKQPGPRIWVSDGGVSGCGVFSKYVYEACKEVVRKGKILQVPSLDFLLDPEAECSTKFLQLGTKLASEYIAPQRRT